MSDPSESALIRKYILDKVKRNEEREEQERLKAESKKREAELQSKMERKKLKEEIRKREEAERDERLMRWLKMQLWRENRSPEDKAERRFRLKVGRRSSKKETRSSEKRRLRKMIECAGGGSSSSKFEDEELNDFQKKAAKAELCEKRKRGEDMAISNSPPLTTPSKERRTKGKIPVTSGSSGKKVTTTSGRYKFRMRSSPKKSPPKQPPARNSPLKKQSPKKLENKRFDPKMKGVVASCGPGGEERYVEDLRRHTMDANIDDLKVICKDLKIKYRNREQATTAITDRRLAEAYDAKFAAALSARIPLQGYPPWFLQATGRFGQVGSLKCRRGKTRWSPSRILKAVQVGGVSGRAVLRRACDFCPSD
ncbi:hypothetical protein CBR_g30983 [Chara braunii]|uniref:Uncharacterized protein n=1 Tax=Chara braunii TaxID=69332 RepID=A0A388LE81_CHABU|nr:hypothetical protein CBR_g30983 [Chara braunii]|eukprot:GBG80522.1 hypothetical protein CBR_g30983 [Chara braunii]